MVYDLEGLVLLETNAFRPALFMLVGHHYILSIITLLFNQCQSIDLILLKPNKTDQSISLYLQKCLFQILSKPTSSNQMRQQCSDRSSIYPQGQSFVFFDNGDYVKRGQYLSKNAYSVERDIRNKRGKLIKTSIKRRPVNKILNDNVNFQNEEDVLKVLIKDYSMGDYKKVRKNQIAILNQFYKKSKEVSTPEGGLIKSKAFCKTPKIQFKLQQALPKIFTADALQYRFKQQQLIARSFINRGYGYTPFLSEVAEHPSEVKIQLHKYRNLLATVVTEALRRIQTFTIEQCCIDIKRVNMSQIKLLLSFLFNCRNHMSAQDCQTFFQYVKMCFYIGDVLITAQASVKLISAIQQELKKKIFEKTGEKPADSVHHSGHELMWTSKGGYTNNKLQLHRIWNGELQRLLIQYYKKEHDLNKMTRYFRRTFPKKQNFFTPQSLKTRLHRTLREGIKKVQFLREALNSPTPIPQIGKVSNCSFKAILDNRHFYKLRVMLLQVYESESCSEKLTRQTIQMLNHASANWKLVRREGRVRAAKKDQVEREQQLDIEIDQLLTFDD